MNNGTRKFDPGIPLPHGNGKHALEAEKPDENGDPSRASDLLNGLGKPLAERVVEGVTAGGSTRLKGDWRSGPDFHWPDGVASGPAAAPWDGAYRAYGCGRDALRALIAHGIAARGWQRLWVPTYYCQKVVAALAASGIELALYPDAPLDPGPGPEPEACRPGDVLLWVNTLGLRTRSEQLAAAGTGLERIEDHTHDPWAPLATLGGSDWCVASLRKTVPLPDGGILWSPRRHALPAAPALTAACRAASLERLAAMSLKQLHRAGGAFPKETYEDLAAAGEAALAAGDVSGMTAWSERLLAAWPIAAWREQRYGNFKRLAAAVAEIPGIQVAAGCHPPRLAPPGRRRERERCAIPFGVPLLCRSAALAALLRRGLASASVTTDQLWPLDESLLPGIPWAHRDFSRRMLLLHCDMRYQEEDLTRVATLVRHFCSVGSGPSAVRAAFDRGD